MAGAQLRVRPARNYHLSGTDIRLDRTKIYPAAVAYNQPGWFNKRKIFCGGILLEQGEYVIVSGKFAPKLTFTT